MMKVLLFGEPLIRISTLNSSQVGDGVETKLYFGGSEVNIACALQALGINTKILTSLPDTSLGQRYLDFLIQKHIDTSVVIRGGKRIGTYYLEEGFGCRQTEVFYDRQYSSICELEPSSLDFDDILHDVSHFHFSGITVALSQSVRDCLWILIAEAKKRHITISMDLNFRSKMINPADAKRLFSQFAKEVDYCFGIEPILAHDKDWEMFNRDQAEAKDILRRLHTLHDRYHFKAIFHTMRYQDQQDKNCYRAYTLDDNNNLLQSTILKTAIKQRVGSGDAFVAGALYQLLQKKAQPQQVMDFAVASATLKCTVETDYMSFSEKQISSILTPAQKLIR